MARKKKAAWVTSQYLGLQYQLIVDTESQPDNKRLQDMGELHGAIFYKFRAAQAIANAINEYIKPVKGRK